MATMRRATDAGSCSEMSSFRLESLRIAHTHAEADERLVLRRRLLGQQLRVGKLSGRFELLDELENRQGVPGRNSHIEEHVVLRVDLWQAHRHQADLMGHDGLEIGE